MRIKIWNAFASNNSGSYTIVGSFPTAELASDVASELAALMEAHELWLQSLGNNSDDGPSPLSMFADKHRLVRNEDIGTGDDWPQYSSNNLPQAFAINHQVIIHHDYTVTLPSSFGQYFYVRGGRVVHELNHAHHPIVAVFELYVPWQERHKVDVKAKVSSLLEALNAPDGPLIKLVKPTKYPPAWQQSKGGFGEADLTVGAIFDDLPTGFTAVDRIAKAHGMQTLVEVFESYGDADPVAFLRSSQSG